MLSQRFLRVVSVALVAYGILGLGVAAALIVVGVSTFRQLSDLSTTLERERTAMVQSIRTASSTLGDTVGATSQFEHSIDSARGAADQASQLANDSAGTFRETSQSFLGLSIFGLQPLAGLAPQLSRSADQLQQVAISLGTTRDALARNQADVRRVGDDIGQLQRQLDLIATALSQPQLIGPDERALLPFQLAFYGLCLLVIVQSAFSLVAGVAVYRVQRALGTEKQSSVRTATTMAAAERDRARAY